MLEQNTTQTSIVVMQTCNISVDVNRLTDHNKPHGGHHRPPLNTATCIINWPGLPMYSSGGTEDSRAAAESVKQLPLQSRLQLPHLQLLITRHVQHAQLLQLG